MATEQEGHTPGPWSVIDNSWKVSTVYGPSGETVAECLLSNAATDATLVAHAALKEANARLIAAAPDLLEALRTVRDWVADAASGQSFFSQAPADIVEMAVGDIARIDAAIARATGEA
ncbi:MAG: hypothetical protein ACTHNA_13995 [Sphingopyxis terrae]|uniref:hypothetical protein n=1 Tax=Sphingopyxis terrae TaxID=33052 RepID=UPI003F7FD2C5